MADKCRTCKFYNRVDDGFGQCFFEPPTVMIHPEAHCSTVVTLMRRPICQAADPACSHYVLEPP